MTIKGTPLGMDALLARLRDIPGGPSADEVTELLRRWRRPASPALERVRQLAALPRVLNREIYGHLTADPLAASSIEVLSATAPSIDELLDAFPNDFTPLPGGTWEMRGTTRDALLTGWQRSERDWRQWNSRLFQYFSRRTDKSSEIEAVHHGAASASPESAVPYFEQRYAAADDRADFAHCHALLEAVRSQETFRGSTFSRTYRDRVKYLQSRLLFLDALQKSGSYLKREAPHAAFDAVRVRTAAQPWIFHIHATGGLGKTMFLRWSVARHLVPARIPCAYVDFDDHTLLSFVQHPLRLLEIILKQWSHQMTHTVLSSAVELLQHSQRRVGWDSEVLDQVRVTLRGAHLQEDMIIVLDTLEEATLAQPEWLKQCVGSLRELHEHLPRLTLVLSGRYDLARIAGILESGEAVSFELRPFARDEAHAYLTLRGITDEDMQAAIVERAVVSDASAVAGSVDPARSSGSDMALNPFKLALMVELAQGAGGLTADEVRRLPNVDIAYLIERVILRIPSQPLRWMVRYGAVARRLTLPLLEAVLLPPLRAALRGQSNDLSAVHLSDDVRSYLDSKVTWTPDEPLAATLKARDLWKDLGAYARERGWVSLVPGQDVLQLHPDVVRPVRVLLSEEPVYRTVHAAARDFYIAQWDRPGWISPAEHAQAAREAIYHATALDPAEGRTLWHRVLSEAGPQTAYAIAIEPTTRAYLNEEDHPLHEDWFGEAHVESARLKLHEAGLAFGPDADAWTSFRLHVAAAHLASAGRVPRVFSTLAAAGEGEGTSDYARAQLLDRALRVFREPYDRLWLNVHAARYSHAAGRDAPALAHWTEAARLAPQAGVRDLQAAIECEIADLHLTHGEYSQGMAAYDRALETRPVATPILERQAHWALRKHDLARALPLIDRLAALGSAAVPMLALRRSVEQGPGVSFNRILEQARGDSTDPDLLAETYVLEAEAWRYRLGFGQALEDFSRAISGHSGRDEGSWSVRARVRQVELYAFDMADQSRARQTAERLLTSTHPSTVEGARLHVVIAFLDTIEGRSTDVSHALRLLAAHPSVTGRCRALLLGTVLGLSTGAEDCSTRLLRALRDVDPPEALVEILGILEHLPAMVHPSRKVYQDLAAIVVPVWRDRPLPPFELALQWLDLLRVWSAPRRDVLNTLRDAVHAMPGEASAARVWYGLRLLDHHVAFRAAKPFTYVSLLAETASSSLGATPLEALLKSRASMELAREGDLEAARRLADEALDVWDRQPHSRYLLQVTRAREDLIAGRVADATRRLSGMMKEAAGPHVEASPHDSDLEASAAGADPIEAEACPYETAEPPADPLDRPPTDIELSAAAAADLEKGFDGLSPHAVSRALFNDWRSVCDRLGTALAEAMGSRDRALRLVTPSRHATLPWEFAAPAIGSRLFCRGVRGAAVPPVVSALERKSVLLIKPEGSEHSFAVNEAASSGFSLEQLYYEGHDSVLVSTLYAPDPEELQHRLHELRPAVVHIVGQVFESSSGVYIDFEGAEARIYRSLEQLAPRRGSSGKVLDSHRLIRYLERQAPFVILDITAPENIVDVVRMLLLRNRFAAELFESGSVRAVLATGLTGPEEREPVARALIHGIVEDTTLADLWSSLRSDDEPQDLAALLSQYGSALFAHQPYGHVCGGDGTREPAA